MDQTHINIINNERLAPLFPPMVEKVKLMIIALEDEMDPILITQGLRTWDEQHALYMQGRVSLDLVNNLRKNVNWAPLVPTDNTHTVTNAEAGTSFHNYGLACFSDDTEILTDDGWKFFPDLCGKESVMVFKDGDLFYEKPLAYISNTYCGDMINITTRSIDLLVTPNHKMVVKKKVSGKWSEDWLFQEASNLDYKYKIPTGGNFRFGINESVPNGICDAETWWEFMGWYISEGSCCGTSDGKRRSHNGRFKISISQKEDSYGWHIIKECLEKLGLHYNYQGHDFIIHSKELWEILFPLGNSYQKRIPRYLLDAPRSLLELLYESLVLGDGGIYSTYETYYTVNKNLADDFTELCIRLGKSCSIDKREKDDSMPHMMPHGELLKTFNPQYIVRTRSGKTQELRNGADTNRAISKENYEGMVYCVSTNAGSVVVRRNGKVSICGNCDVVPITSVGQPDWCDSHPDWQRIIVVAAAQGLEHGDRGFHDNPHFQLVAGTTPQLLKTLYKPGDLSAVWAEVSRRL